MYYLIRETLEICGPEELVSGVAPYVAVLTPEEWRRDRDAFAMGIDMEGELPRVAQTRAVVNYDSLTGSIALPPKGLTGVDEYRFAFALDERGVEWIAGA